MHSEHLRAIFKWTRQYRSTSQCFTIRQNWQHAFLL